MSILPIPFFPPISFSWVKSSAGDFFFLKSIHKILSHGMPSLKEAIVTGQYEYPKGLFFGGFEPSQSQLILKELLMEHLATSQKTSMLLVQKISF